MQLTASPDRRARGYRRSAPPLGARLGDESRLTPTPHPSATVTTIKEPEARPEGAPPASAQPGLTLLTHPALWHRSDAMQASRPSRWRPASLGNLTQRLLPIGEE